MGVASGAVGGALARGCLGRILVPPNLSKEEGNVRRIRRRPIGKRDLNTILPRRIGCRATLSGDWSPLDVVANSEAAKDSRRLCGS